MGLRSHEQWQELLFCRPSHITKCFNCRTVQSQTSYFTYEGHTGNTTNYSTQSQKARLSDMRFLCVLCLHHFFAICWVNSLPKIIIFLICLSALFLWGIFFFFTTGCTSAFISKPFFGFSPKVSSHAFPTKTYIKFQIDLPTKNIFFLFLFFYR